MCAGNINAMNVRDKQPLPKIMRQYADYERFINRMVYLANGDRWLVYDVFKNYIDENGVLDYESCFAYVAKNRS